MGGGDLENLEKIAHRWGKRKIASNKHFYPICLKKSFECMLGTNFEAA